MTFEKDFIAFKVDIFSMKIYKLLLRTLRIAAKVNTRVIITRFSTYRLLNEYRKIFGTSSYGEDAHLRVRLRHMNECRIFYDILSITFFIIYPLISNGGISNA